MKRLIVNGFDSIKTSTRKLLKDIHNNTLNKNNDATNSQFIKVECFDPKSKENLNTIKTNYTFVKIEKEDPEIVTLSDNQKKCLEEYMNKSMFDYHNGDIHLDDLLLKKFKNIDNA